MKRIFILGKVPFDMISDKKLLKEIYLNILFKRKVTILNMNTFGVVNYLKNDRYSKIINKAQIIYSDGWGPVVASWSEKDKLSVRVNVGDYILNLLEMLNRKKGIKIYLLGSEKNVVTKAASFIKDGYKNIKIVGLHDGFFTKNLSRSIVSEINKTKPHLVLVGMGVPIQEYWIDENFKDLPNSVYMGVGGVFHYLAKTKSRAPVWVRNSSLEWVYRLLQEPRRLFKRYTLNNLEFIYAYIKYLLAF